MGISKSVSGGTDTSQGEAWRTVAELGLVELIKEKTSAHPDSPDANIDIVSTVRLFDRQSRPIFLFWELQHL